MSQRYFGTDGIRGLANRHPMTPDVALQRRAWRPGASSRERQPSPPRRDRQGYAPSGYMIEQALIAGFTAVGMDVFLFGPLPTPAVAMLTRSLRADLGVMISASHNPYHDNGIKLFDPDGYKLSDETEREIEAPDRRRRWRRCWREPDKIGRAKRIENAQARYIEFAKRTFPQRPAPGRPAHRHRLRQWRAPTRSRPRRCGSWAPRSSPSASSPTASTST